MIVEYKFSTNYAKEGVYRSARRWHVWALFGFIPLYVRTWRT